MQIRTRLTLQVLLLGGLIMLITSIAIFYSSASFRKEDFNNRLRNQSRSIARFILNPYEPDENLARIIENDNPANLQNKKIIILNSLNDTIYTSNKNSELELTPEILGRIRTEGRVMYKQGSFDVLGTLYTVGNAPFVVIAAAVDMDGISYLKKLRTILIVVWGISLLLFFIAGWFYSGRALKPISDVIKKVDDISISSLNLRVPEGNGKDELGRLARTFNKMLDRLETSFAMQKNFIANASHELRTPLTAINGQIEVLMMKDRTSGEYKSAIGSVLDDIKSLIGLLNRLLLVARTSAEGPSGFSNNLRIDEILWQAREDMKKFNAVYHININMDDTVTDSEKIIVAGDEYLLKVAVSNIMENACKYSSDHTVNIRFGCTNNYIEVVFEDKGIGISEEEIIRIFEPFYRGSNAKSVSGSGIGLSLVNQIIKNHNGSLEISSEIGKGTRILLKLPATPLN
jgi:signal transduction histidine kinase